MGAQQLTFLWYTMASMVMIALVWWMVERAVEHLRQRYTRPAHLARPAFAPAVAPIDNSTPASAYDHLDNEEPADKQTDEQTDPVSAHYDAVGRLQVDKTRGALIEVLVMAGWDVGRIRGTIKGDNGTIGVEVAEARLRLGMDAPTRTVKVSERIDGKPQTREVTL